MNKTNAVDTDQCNKCGRVFKGLLEYSEYSHLKPCVTKDINGVSRKSMEPVFTPPIDLCYTCYKNSSKKYVLEVTPREV